MSFSIHKTRNFSLIVGEKVIFYVSCFDKRYSRVTEPWVGGDEGHLEVFFIVCLRTLLKIVLKAG